MVELRRQDTIPFEVSLVRDIRDREFKVFSDAGRVMRPLFVVEQDDNGKSGVPQGHLTLTKEHIQRLELDREIGAGQPGYFGWKALLDNGIVEYLDAEEEETSMICMSPEDLDSFRLAKMGIPVNTDDPENPNKRIPTKMNPTTHIYTHCGDPSRHASGHLREHHPIPGSQPVPA